VERVAALNRRLSVLRIEEAKRRLEQTDLAVDEISYEVRYQAASFFRRVFKRLRGLSPSQYRRMFRPVLSTREGTA
jgi:transcriptional regulator GlxA family with amidase domain